MQAHVIGAYSGDAYDFKPGQWYGPWRSDDWILDFSGMGERILEVRRRETDEYEKHQLQAGMWVLLAPHTQRKLRLTRSSPSYHHRWIHFHCEEMESVFLESIHFVYDDCAVIEAMLKRLLSLAELPSTANKALSQRYLELIIAELLQARSASEFAEHPCTCFLAQPLEANRLLQEFDALVLPRLPGSIPVVGIAEAMQISVPTLNRRFARELGISPGKRISYLRLRMARDALLSNPERSVAAIAHAFGYQHAGHFAKKFQESFGLSPSALRSSSCF